MRGPTDETYEYDAAGNITTQRVDGTTTDYTYDRNRLTQATIEGQTSHHAYDGFGRLTRITAAGQTIRSYAYDGFDRLIRDTQTLPDQPTVETSTAYDPLDRARLKTVVKGQQAPEKTRYTYLGFTEQVAVEEEPDPADPEGSWLAVKSYHYGPDGRPLILDHDEPAHDDQAAIDEEYLYSINPHGDTELLTDPDTGQAEATYRYTAYGNPDQQGTTGLDAEPENPSVTDTEVVNPYRFNSKRLDGATDTYDMGFRNYDPGLNRYLTRDMYNGALNDLALGLDPWNTNRYAFTGGNPITMVELDGHLLAEGASGGGGGGGDSALEEILTAPLEAGPDDAPASDPLGGWPPASTGGTQGSAGGGSSTSAPMSAGCCTQGFASTGDVFTGGGKSTYVKRPGNPEVANELALAGCGWLLPVLGWGCDAYDVKRAIDESGVTSGGFAASIVAFAPGGDLLKAPRQATRIADATKTRTADVCSFAGATTVLMADGSRKPIQDVKVGDKVVATDPETGEQVAKTVEHVFVHDDTVVDLVVDGEVITTTEDHPFWSISDQRFERADELSLGERVLSADGRVIPVSGLELGTEREALAYNLEVEGIHTYHVGDGEILVHNACRIPSKSNYRDLFKQAHPNMPDHYQVHHALPQKYAGIMERAGVNIHDPSMLRGVDPAIHTKITTAWGRWERGLGRTPTAHDITQFSYRIDEMYGSSFVW